MLPVTSIQDLMTKTFPEQTWVVDHLIANPSITILSGAPASYKTYTALAMAIAVATGKPFLGEFEVTPTGVVVVDQENGEPLLHRMLDQLQAPLDLPIYFYSDQGFTLNDKCVDHILEQCQENDAKLVILDSYVRIFNGDENKPGDTATAFKYLKRFTKEGISVLIIHHNRKPSANGFGGYGNEMRGSSDLLAAPDGHIALVRKGDKVTFYQTKQRHSREIAPFEVTVKSDDDEHFEFEYAGATKKEDKEAPIREAIVMLLQGNTQLFQRELLEQLRLKGIKVNEHKLRKIIGDMLADKVLDEASGPGNTTFLFLMTA
jgi:RecA-family ATPase